MFPYSIDFECWNCLTFASSKINPSDLLSILLKAFPRLVYSHQSVFLCLIKQLNSLPLDSFHNLDVTLHTLRHAIDTLKMLLLKLLHQYSNLLLKLPHLGIDKL